MNRHSSLPPGDCGMQGAAARRPPRRGGFVFGAGGLVGGVEDSSGGKTIEKKAQAWFTSTQQP